MSRYFYSFIDFKSKVYPKDFNKKYNICFEPFLVNNVQSETLSKRRVSKRQGIYSVPARRYGRRFYVQPYRWMNKKTGKTGFAG